jgi:hypothetical protein
MSLRTKFRKNLRRLNATNAFDGRRDQIYYQNPLRRFDPAGSRPISARRVSDRMKVFADALVVIDGPLIVLT